MQGDEVVRSALRVLSLIEALNHCDGAQLSRLQELTGLAKPTIVRLLQTLVQGGYVRRVSRAEGYVVTERVLALASGFKFSETVVAVARTYLDSFTAINKWPINVQTYERGAMRTRYTTASRSPLNADRAFRPQRFPLLTTAHGQAYLAFCSAQEREAILKMLRASKSRGNAMAHETAFVEKTLSQVHSRGYSLRPAGSADRVIGFAVPVTQGLGVAATIGMRYFGTAMSPDEAVHRYLKILQDIAAAVADGLSHHEALCQPPNAGPA